MITARIAYLAFCQLFDLMKKHPEGKETIKMEAIMIFESLPQNVRDELFYTYKLEYLTIVNE